MILYSYVEVPYLHVPRTYLSFTVRWAGLQVYDTSVTKKSWTQRRRYNTLLVIRAGCLFSREIFSELRRAMGMVTFKCTSNLR